MDAGTTAAVFVDGPLKGTVEQIDAHMFGFGMMWTYAPEMPDADFIRPGAVGMQDFETVHYRFSRAAMFGRVILVASVAQPPDPQACFDALCSDLAKQSAVIPA